jgi:hypothetical protein
MDINRRATINKIQYGERGRTIDGEGEFLITPKKDIKVERTY